MKWSVLTPPRSTTHVDDAATSNDRVTTSRRVHCSHWSHHAIKHHRGVTSTPPSAPCSQQTGTSSNTTSFGWWKLGPSVGHYLCLYSQYGLAPRSMLWSNRWRHRRRNPGRGKGEIAPPPFSTRGGNQCKMPLFNANYTKFTALY